MLKKYMLLTQITSLLITSSLLIANNDSASKPIKLRIPDSAISSADQAIIIHLCTKELERREKQGKAFSDITFYQCKEKDPSNERSKCFNLIGNMEYWHDKGYDHDTDIRNFVRDLSNPKNALKLTPVAVATDQYNISAPREVYILFPNPENPHIIHMLMTGDSSLSHTHSALQTPSRTIIIESGAKPSLKAAAPEAQSSLASASSKTDAVLQSAHHADPSDASAK